MKNYQTFVLALLGAGALLAILQYMQSSIRAQVNRCLPPDQQITSRQAQNLVALFGERGLLVRHASFYPASRLVTAFKVVWGVFWVLLAALMLTA